MFKKKFPLIIYFCMAVIGGIIMVLSSLPEEDHTLITVSSFIVAVSGIILVSVWYDKNMTNL